MTAISALSAMRKRRRGSSQLTIVAAGEMSDRYNGQQGDIWDAQKDMAFATLGAIMAWAFPRARRR